MQRWEYLTMMWTRNYGRTDYYINSEKQKKFKNMEMHQVLNVIGAQGWELVGVDGDSYSFKRPKQAKANEEV